MVGYILLILIVFYFGFCFYYANEVINVKLKTDEDINGFNTKNNWYDQKWFDELDKQEIIIKSPYSYDLSATFIKSMNLGHNTIIISHGVTVNRLAVVKFAKMFINRGYNILLYDHRCHGKSGGKHTSYGYYEKVDLEAVIKWAKTKYPKGIVGIIGESMGAAIALQSAAISPDIDFTIADCSFTSMVEELAYQFKHKFRFLPPIFMFGTKLIIRYWAKFEIDQVSPVEAVKKINTPCMIVHGDTDDYVPYYMADILYKALLTDKKKLYIAKDTAHASSWDNDPKEYNQMVGEFLEENNLPS